MIGTIKALIDRTLVPAIGYVVRKTGYRNDVNKVLQDRAIRESADFYEREMAGALRFKDRYPLFDLSLRNATVEGLILEFGSYKGKSLRYIAPKVGQKVFGFDSFAGLKEDWRGTAPAGTFDVGGKLPHVPRNVELMKGWFQDTLPPFLARRNEPVRFLHLDADTFEATDYVLRTLEPRLVPGSVIQFDEFFGYPGWQHHEYKAFRQFIERTGLGFAYLGFGWMSVAVRLEGREKVSGS